MDFGAARSGKYFRTSLAYIAIVVATFVFLFPIVWTVMTSFKPPSEYFQDPPTLFPHHWTGFHYVEAFVPWVISESLLEEGAHYWVQEASGRANPLTPAFVNSLIITGATVFLTLLIGLPMAYALSRFKFKGSKNLAVWILSIRMIPPIVTIIPLFVLLRTLRLIDNYLGIIIPDIIISLPFVVWMMKGFFDEIPRELEEAATIDGGGLIQIFRSVMLPLSIGGIVTTALFCVYLVWNEFMFALILTGRTTHPLSVALSTFKQDRGVLWGQMSATVVVTTLPLLVLTLLFQKRLVRGLTAGSLK